MLRLPDSYDAKIAKICNLWTFWPVIQLIKDGLLIELQARTSESSKFLLLLHHNYQVSLIVMDKVNVTLAHLSFLEVTIFRLFVAIFLHTSKNRGMDTFAAKATGKQNSWTVSVL